MPRLARLASALLLPFALAACQGASSVPCQAVEGDVIIRDAAGWKAFVDSGCPVVRGNLLIVSDTLVEPIGDPALVEVTGDLGVAFNAQLQGLALPNLKIVGGSLDVGGGNSAMQELSLPALTSVGSLILSLNTGVGRVELPALTSVGSSVQVGFNTGVGRVDLPVLTRVGGDVLITGNTGLAAVSLPALTAVTGYLDVTFNEGLEALDLRAVASVQDSLHVEWNGGLTAVSFPALASVAQIRVVDNAALGILSLPALESTDGFYVYGNPVLPECQPLAVKDRLIASGGLVGAYSWIVQGNDASGTCGP